MDVLLDAAKYEHKRRLKSLLWLYRVSQNSRIPCSERCISSPNMEIKKKSELPPTKIHWSEGALFEVRFL
jgi:DNA mismatch repair protein MutH